MVEDAITDGKRIAEFLASELTGLATGPLAQVSVVDADSDAEVDPAGAFAYAIEYAGERIGSVTIYPDKAVVDLADVSVPRESATPPREGLAVDADADGGRIVVSNAAAVKSAVDVLRDALPS